MPKDGLEIPILAHFVHHKKTIIDKMKDFVENQLELMTQPFSHLYLTKITQLTVKCKNQK